MENHPPLKAISYKNIIILSQLRFLQCYNCVRESRKAYSGGA
jgi:hypothetical protein